MYHVYIAGPVSGLSPKEIRQSRDIIKDVLELHGLTYIDPLDGFDLTNPEQYTASEIVLSNKMRILQCKCLLAAYILPQSVHSMGMLGELIFAKMHNKVTIGYGNPDYIKHPWISAHLDLFYPSLEEALDYISKCLV